MKMPKKRARYAHTVPEIPAVEEAACDMEGETDHEEESSTVRNSTSTSEACEEMEIDFLRVERNSLLTKISCLEQQVGEYSLEF